MAETVKVEIPITATDKTAGGVSSAQRRIDSLERSVDKMQRKFDKMNGSRCKVDIDANNTASDKIAEVDDSLQKTNGKEANVDVGANDAASGVVNAIGDKVDELDGDEAVVDAEAEDAASGVLGDVDDKLSELNGSSATVDVEAEDAASGPIDEVDQKADALDGKTATILIRADDQASDVINGAANAAKTPLAGAAAVMGASFGVYDSVSTYAGFEAAMSQVKAISGAAGEEFDALTEKAKYMGSTTKFTATESAEAFNYMAMAGWKTDDMLNGIEGVMNLAAASGESLATTSDIVTDALTAFGMKASDSTHFADVMAQASANANTNVGMMGESFKYVAPVAGAMGYTIEDTALALGLMANAGVKSSMAGTALRRAITSLAAPTDKQATAMEKYGISLTRGDGTIKSLNEVMGDLRTNLSGLTQDEQTAAVTQMFGNQAMAGMLAIVNASADDFDKLSSAVNNADGASKNMADTMLDNMQGSFTLMQSAIEGVEDELGEKLSPYMRGLADTITAAMPAATQAIDNLFADIDEKVSNMTFTKEWTEADFFGKVDIAWDTLIAEPFRQWAGNEGALAISDVVGGLFENAFKILPGGESPGLTSWLSAGVLTWAGLKIGGLAAKVAEVSSAIAGLGAAGTTFGAFASAIGTAAPWILAGVAAIAALNIAIDAYNQKQIKADLEAHFGDIKLNEEELQALSEEILELDWKANINLALNELKNADALRSDAEDKLNQNDAIEYKAKVGVTLTEDDTSAYTTNVETFIADRKKELDGRTFAAKLLVSTTLSTPEGETLSAAIDSWTLQDNIEMSALSNQLSETVSEALKDGIINADEEDAITALQDKINAIVDKWKVAQQQAARDMLTDKYGNLSGEQLSAGSYEALVQEMAEQRAAAADSLDQSTEEFYTILHAMDNAGRLQEAGLTYEGLRKQWQQAIQYEKDREIANDLTFQSNTLNRAYSEEGATWNAGASERSSDALQSLIAFGNTQGAASMFINDNANAGLNKMFDTYMSGQVDDMYSTLQNYMSEFGGKVPEELRNAYMNAVETGAFAGSDNTLVASQMLANSIAETADQALISAIKNGDYGEEVQSAFASGSSSLLSDALTAMVSNGQIDDSKAEQLWKQQLVDQVMNGAYGEDLQNALAIAMAEGTDELATVDGLQAEISELEVTQQSAANVRRSVQDFMDATSESGAEVEYDAGNVTVKVGEGADTSGLQNALNMTEEELAGYKIEVEGGEVEYRIPEDQILSAQERAAQEIAAESGGEFKIDGGEAYVEWHIDEGQTLSQISEATGVAMDKIAETNGIEDVNVISAGATIKIPADSITVDTSEVSGAAAGESVDIGDVDATATANADVEAGEIDPSGAYDTASQETQSAFDTAMETSGSTNVTLDQTNNADEVYSGVSGDVQSKFNSAISASGTVNVTLAWHITNPAASISVGVSGGSATATISSAGMANGGFVDGAMLSLIGEDGPEFIIPVGSKRKGRGAELWAKAGEALGMFGGIPAFADGGVVGMDEDAMIANPFEAKKTSNNVWEGLFGSDPNNSTPNVLESLLAATGGPQGDNNDTTNGVNVNVSMSPVIQIEGSGMNEDEIFGVMKRRIKECADDVAYEVGEKLTKTFSNMPLAQGV